VQSWLGIAFPVEARLMMRKRYGRVFRSNDSIAGELFHIADRDLVEEMFKWKPTAYEVAEPRQVMEPVVGPASLLLLDGDRHMRMRKLMLPPFHGQAIAHYAELIERITDREIDKWSPGETVRTRGVAQTITLEVMIRTVFGVSDPDRIAELKRRLPRLSSINPVLLAMQKDLGPLSPWGRFLRNRDRVDEILYEEIGQRREDPDPDAHDDILTLLLSARDEEGDPLTDRELRDELITILLAGHETTATSIGWAFERLLRTPPALERLTAEVKAGESSEYLDATIKETLRVRPVVTEVFRSPSEPTELGGYLFEPGSQLAASISLLQWDPDLYAPDPFAFRPERFLEGAPEPYTWIPFGGGVRRCIGASFAQLEMKIAIARILTRTRLRARRAKDEKSRFRGVTVLPSRGGEAVVESVTQ
jgi:cytochrome P450 family 135